VTHYETAKINFITSRAEDIIRASYYIRGTAALDAMKLIFAVLQSRDHHSHFVGGLPLP